MIMMINKKGQTDSKALLVGIVLLLLLLLISGILIYNYVLGGGNDAAKSALCENTPFGDGECTTPDACQGQKLPARSFGCPPGEDSEDDRVVCCIT
jgi:hypothetical protein